MFCPRMEPKGNFSLFFFKKNASLQHSNINLPNPLENGIAHCQMVKDEVLSDEMVSSQPLQ